MKLESLIHQNQSVLSELDRSILHYIMTHRQQLDEMGIVAFAEQVHASKSSILRLTQKLGFSGYTEFKYFLRHEQLATIQPLNDKTIFEKQIDDIKQTLAYMQSVDLLPINQLFEKSKTIYCYSTGFSQKKPLEEFSKMLLTMEKRVLILPNETELDMAMPMIRSDDCVIITSLSGETEKIKENLSTFEMRKIPVLTITAPGDNYFARHATYHLNYYCDFFQIGRNKIPSQSLIGLHCLVDYLIRAYGHYTLLEGEK